MSREMVYNVLASAEEVDNAIKRKQKEESGGADIDAENAPQAQDAGGVNVEENARTKAKSYEYKNLQAELEITPTPKNFRIFAGMTVKIVGVGKYLSGFYYVMGRKVSISGGGAMTITLTVTKTKFGDSLKGEPPIHIEKEDLIGDDGTGDVYDSGGQATTYEDGTGGHVDSAAQDSSASGGNEEADDNLPI